MKPKIAMGAILIVTALATMYAQNSTELMSVKKIYVDSLGNSEGAAVVRSKVVSQLAKSPFFQVVLDKDKADAVLIGATAESSSSSFAAVGSIATGGTHAGATAGIQLVDKQNQIIWADDITSMKRKSATSGLAESIVRDLSKAMTKARQDAAKATKTANKP